VSAKEKVMNNYLVSLSYIEDVSFYKENGISTFLLPLKDYSIGYNPFTIEEINALKERKYCLINKVLDNKQIDTLITKLPLIDVEGFVIEDVGLIDTIRKLNKKIILFINHFNCNYYSINEWLKYVDSIMVSNELTYEELQEIDRNTIKKVCYHLLGYNQIMYSKRQLLTNYGKHYDIDISKKEVITDTLGQIKFNIYEDSDGTIIYSDKVFFDKRILLLKNVYFFYINTMFLTKKEVIDILEGRKKDISSGFLDKETVYKVGDLK